MVGKVLYIKYKEIVDGQIVEKVRYAVDRWQADDKYMGESFITFTVKSSKPIAFSVGDYCEYRGETYTLNYIPSVSQRANIGGSGEAFVYEQVKMDSPREELDRAIMLDVTPTTGDYIAALGTNYTGSAQFQLYCGETTANGRTLTPVCALAAKMQANLDRAFPDKGWKVLVDTTSTHEEAGQQVLNTHSDEKTLTFDNTTIANALAEVKNTFEIDFAVKGRTIYIGYTFGAITGNNDGDYYYFGYGKGYLSEDNQGKALFELKRTSDSGQKIVTRLRALGSTKNMPYRYYNKKYNLSQSLFPMNLQLPDTFETPEVKAKHNKERKAVYPWIRDVLGDTNDAYIDKNDNCLDTVEGLREDCMRWDGTNADLKEIYPSIEEVTYGELRAALCEDQDGNKGSSAFPHYGNNERVDEILDIDTDTNVGDGILTESDSTRQTASDTDVRLSSSETASSLVYMGSGYISKEKEVMNIPSQYAGNYIISNSHLWFRASYSLGRHQTETITKTCKVAYQIKVYAKDLSTNKESVICTYISDYKQISNREAKEYEVEIAKLPDVDAEVQKVDKITVTNPSDIRITFALIVKDIDYSYDQWNVNWNLGLSLYQNPDTDTEWTPSLIWDLEGSASTFMKNPFHVYVKDMGFDFVAAFGTSDTPRIAMKSGMCVAREFEIGNNPQKVEYTKGGITYKAWRLTLAKAEDSSLKTYYPSENFPLAAGDNFVIIGIEMPDVYIQAASMKLLVEATKALADVCDTKHEYEPSVDGIYIQRNYDRCEEEGDVTKSVYWKLGAGMKFPFFGIAEEGKETPDMFSMIIDTLSIREGEGLTPNISIKLSEDFQQSTLQKLTRTVTSITNGSIFKATNIGNGGGLDESSVRAIVSEFTKRRFLSKLNPDTAAGVITFLQGTNWGNFTSETGAAMTVDPNTGQTYMEVDRLKVRLKAFFEKLEIQKVGFVGGKLIVTKGQGVDILDVENIYDSEGNVSAYRCYFLGEQEGRKIDNLLRVKDQMICKDFNVSEGSTDGATNKYYWRLVTAVSSDVVKRGNYVCHWVDLSATDCDTNSDIPEIGDTICHLGNREDTDRQGAEILSVVDANSPSFTIYSGINSYSLVNKEYIDMGVAGGKAFCNIYGSTYIGDRNRENGYISWDYDKEENVWKMRVKGTIDITSQLSSGGTIGGAITDAANAYKGEFDAFTSNVNEVIGGFQAQIDGVIETWFYDPEPTLGNLPASEWKDNTTKDKHLGDLYYSGDGLAYRFQKEGDIYKWVRIDDTAITSALKEAKAAKEAAAAAQGTADTAQTTAESKMKVFVVQPTNNDEYSVGDMWVNATYSDANVSYSNDILKCKEGKAAGAEFKIAHWEKASKYTDDTKANEALTKVGNLQTDVTELGESFDTLTNTTLPALSDGIITTSEKENIRQALMQVQKECVDVINAYTNLTVNYESIYDKIAADVRTNFATAYTQLMGSATLSSDGTITYTSGQGGAYGALVDNINALLNKEGNLTTNEIATINNNIANFNIKYNDFQNRLVVVRNDIEKTLDTRITDVDEQLGGYAYLKKIVGGKTTIDGGLVLTTMLGTGYEVTGGAYKIMSGISGLYETAKSVAIWAGGSMIDKFVYYDAESGKFNVPADVNPANFLVRMDGTGYAAGGNFWWDNDGKIHADPQSFLINEQYVGNVMQLFQLHYKVAGDTAFTNVDYVTPTRMFNGLELSDLGLKIGDTAKFYIKDGVLFLEGDLAVTGGITMYATDGVTSGLLDQVYAILDSSKFEIENGVITIKGEIGDGKVKGATLGGVAVTLNANGILEFDAYPTTLPASDVYAWAKAATKPTYSWGEITDKPSTFTPVAHTHDDRYYTETEIDTKLGLKLDTSLKGVANGLATLDASGKVPSAQLPSYVDDVIEHINKASFPTTGESGKIYIDQTTNLTYRWGGTAYVEISQSLALGETSSTAYAGDKGKQNATDIAALKTGKADKATTLAGYGITDAYTKTQTYTQAEVNTKLTDGSVTKVGKVDVGSATKPIYLKAGVPTAVGTSLAVDITGNSATTSKLKTAVTLWGQSFDGSKAITGNLTNVGTITPTGEDLKVVGNLIVTGGIVMYADDGATIESGFAALLAAHIDGVTIKYNEAQQKIYSVMTGIKVNGATYKPSETDGYITIPDYPTSLDWENIENKPSTFTPSSHTHTFASLTSKPTTLSGYGITDAKIANGVITLGTATITPLTTHQTVTLASGTNNGTLKLTVGSKTTDNIAVKGLGSAAYTDSSAYATAGHTHNYAGSASAGGDAYSANKINSRGNLTAYAEGATTLGESGVNLYTVYNNGYPVTFGNLLHIYGSGAGQLLAEWTGSSALGHLYYRSKRDNADNGWSAWGKVAFVTDNVASASKWATARTITLTGSVTGSVSIDGSGNVTLATTTNHTHSYVPLSGGTMSGNLILKGGTSADMTYAGNVHPSIRFDNSDSSQNVSLIFTDYDSYRAPAGLKLVGNQGNEWFEAANIYATTFYGALSGNATTATTATKLGTANVGSGTQHFYLNGGTATASTSTVGGTAKPMYLNAGVMTTISATVGSTSLPVYLNAGTITACSTTLGVSVTGNAATATTLQTARTLWGQSFNGSANISGNMSGVGQITFSALSGTNGRALLYQQMADNDYFRIYCGGTGNNGGYAEIATADDGTEPIYVRQYSGVFGTLVRTLTLLDGNGNTTVPGLLTAANGTVNSTLKVGAIPVTNSSTGVLKIDGNLIVTGGITMYATDGVASGLMEQILVDGTTIGKKADGTLYAINTGNVRSIIMGSTTYTPNDSGAVTLPEKVTWANIEGKPSTFAPSSHTHSYLPLAGGTLTGALVIQETTSAASYAMSGGAFHAGYANIILRGNSSTGVSGIVFTSSKGTTNINQTSDRGFIQFHAYGVAPAAEGTDPTLSTSGEVNRLVIGVGNDGDDMVYIQTPASTGLRHLVGTSAHVILDSGNFGDYAAAKSHTHAISQITNLQATLDGKAAASHTHSYLPLSGGTMTGVITLTSGSSAAYDKTALSFIKSSDKTEQARIGTDGGNGLGLYANGSIYIRPNVTLGSSSTNGLIISSSSFTYNGTAVSLAGHTHSYLPLAGGTMTGALNFKNSTWNLMGDDAYIGDCDVAGMIGVKGANAATPGFVLYNNSGTLLGKLYASGGTLVWNGGTIQATTFSGNASTASLLALNTNPTSTVATAVGTWSPVSDKVYVYRQRWTNSAIGSDTADLVVYLDGNLTANMCLDGYYFSLLGFKKSGSSDSYVLLGGGGHKALSDFATSGHNHDGRYLRYFRYTTSPNADSMEDGWHDAKAAITNAPTTNHGTLIQNSYNGTPFQIFIPDASYYIYKRYKSGSIGGTWTKISAGYADSADKLTSSAGSATLPIYFSDGKPVACTMSTGNGTGIVRSFGRGAYTSANQYFGNGTIVTIDPKGTGCISANDTILSLGDTSIRNTQLLVAFDRDGVYYRRITDGLSYGDWKRLAFTTDTVANSDTCDGLHVHGGRNNEANKIVRTDGNGYLQVGYINSSSGDEGNNSSPARVWGTNGSDSYMRTYLTSALSVKYAASAGNADTVDGYHASALWRSDGATWNPDANVSLTASANNQEWSFDIRRNGHTGCYWHVWDSSLNSMLKVTADNGKVYAPYNFVGNLEGNASTASKWATARTITLTGSVTGSVSIDGSGNVSLATTTNHTHSYLPLAGGTMTGQIQRAGQGSSWIKGRDNAMIRVNSKSGYSVLSSIKTTNGSWEIGHYDASGHYNDLLFGYYTDDAYSANNNSGQTKITFTSGGQVTATQFNGALSGNASSATKLQTARSIFGQNFDGSAAINGQGTFYGTYKSTANARYGHSALQIRENDLVTTNQSDLAYAPSIGFHWGGRTAATLLYGSDSVFYLRKQDFTTRASLDANLVGNAATASKWATARTLTLTGSVTGSVSIDGSGNVTLATTTNHTHSYLPLSGGTMTAGARISHADGNMYLGRADNNGWVMCQDMCSQTASGDGYWSLRTNGTFHALTTYIGGHLWLNKQNASSSTSGASQLIFGNNGTQHVVITSNTGAIIVNPSTSSYTGQVIIRVGASSTSEFAGNIKAGGGITMYSDLRKKNILSNEVLSVKEIAAAPLFRHTYKSDDNQYIHVGTSAQYWSSIHEDWFTRKDSEGYYQMELQNLGVAMGISLAREIVKYESKTDKKIRLMKKKINDLEARIKELEGSREERRTA